MCADSLTFPIETSKDIGNNLLRNREFSEHEVNINGTRKMLRVLAVDQECQSRIIAFFGQLRAQCNPNKRPMLHFRSCMQSSLCDDATSVTE